MSIVTHDLNNLISTLKNQRNASTKLTLRGRDIGDSDVIRLANTLLQYPTKNNPITSMDLSFNKVGPAGAQALGKLLERNGSLVELDLRNNLIGPEGVEALGKALEVNSTLTDIYFSYNTVGDRGAQVFLESMKYNSSLTWVGRLYGNDLSEDLMQDVMNVVSENNNGQRTQVVNLHRAKRVFPTLIQKCPVGRQLVFELQTNIWELCFGEIQASTNIHDYPPDLKILWNQSSRKRTRDEMIDDEAAAAAAPEQT
mmetsp:Transcript_19716/g.29257  ORF Transcript_19716/g.29257 Transcript_19716/m.29257 type:complete len:255 (+) Transcript_19716:57-821(+)|eukprot:CAMPEP_0194246128 /NCGR_PEP_ID=MMETSP0158-20130606/14489_1 /TAXON_ID=33649 /ORGANISM="Thalassionema nitzschioides, Strain L26-B" /LENGTH=254 /DNA_ID=CAMNT_0038981961 /DNA_START=12 /DNA_END=776 /DNA_ORIENTATION=+